MAVATTTGICCRLGCPHPGGRSGHDHIGSAGLIKMIGVPRPESRSVAGAAGDAVRRRVGVPSWTVGSRGAGNTGAVGRIAMAGKAVDIVDNRVGAVATGAGRSNRAGPADPGMTHAAGGGEGTLGPVAVPPRHIVPVDAFAAPVKGRMGSVVVMAAFAAVAAF